ncbi:hypothetical protein A3C59_03230 [Candidatus Daviesbacteria bacterium RIFCSPHIGHO2_02_FULL_36_13]|uniref:DegT/DnrJ/EryC1/StrS aminotransferase n=1 Tax=Candidatus Daviesbacteria bacterium RIFCSPHIGHO2_02_FULL_36_13 TaxID=1797768 RepID=A0A1F5JPZ3_9BACT|nr:MAG: hypothetical protein A3C59_03230 [Candidatus Daviesbacteria bacterium RIFCSPHIGHO2_02_FULL_36_13]OGE43228.1 MAG: hypothetical protein A3A45_03165 [Candidatus Daviesbacteria bacterium RIFCSPLOWO2_01_FULL_36_8]
MNIFNSLGSNYDFKFVLKALLSFSGNSKDLENLLGEKYGGKAILLYKGREAIELALKSLNLPAGTFVAINGFTCFAMYDAIKKSGLNVEYLDIEKGELNFSAETFKKALDKNPKIKVVIIQNTLGFPCDIKGISKICKEKGIILIEDLAHSIGAKYEGEKEAGTLGDMTILSFSQDKMIDGISGGALVDKGRKMLQEKLYNLPLKQQIIDSLYPSLTFRIRLTYPFLIGKVLHEILKRLNLLSKPMTGAETGKLHKLPGWYSNLIMGQFDKLNSDLSHRRKIASIYAETLNPNILSKRIIKQIADASNLRFPIFVNNRGDLIKYLAQNGIYVSDIWYDAPISPKKYLSQSDYNHQCPNSELASSAILNLPTHKNVAGKDAVKISNIINQWLSQQ